MPQNLDEALEEISELRSKLAATHDESKQLHTVINATGVGIWDWQVQSGETIFNERWANIIGYSLEELSPVSIETWMEYAHPDDLKESGRLLELHWNGETDYYIFESRMMHKNGGWVWVYDTGKVIEWTEDGKPKRMVGTHIDITENKRLQASLLETTKKLEALSLCDPLTELHNRRAYEARLAKATQRHDKTNKSLSLLVVDIDFFKQFNDAYGHERGDVALVKVGEIIKSSLFRSTDFIARYGGEEFVIILEDTPLASAESVAERIVRNVKTNAIPHAGTPHDNVLTVSIGISSTDLVENELFCYADKALYKAKNKGRNRYDVASTET